MKHSMKRLTSFIPKLLVIRDNRLGGGEAGIIQPVINDLETIYQAEAQSSSHTVGFIPRMVKPAGLFAFLFTLKIKLPWQMY